MLREIGVIKRPTKSSEIFDEYCRHFYETDCCPSDYIRLCQEAYLNSPVEKKQLIKRKYF